MSPKERLLGWAAQHRYQIVVGSWLATMVGAGAYIFAKNPTQTFSQKLVQGRMVAQGATVAVLIATAGLSQFQFEDENTRPQASWKQSIEQPQTRAPPLGSNVDIPFPEYSLWTCSETMMAEHDHNEGFASVAWDRETDGGPFGSSALAAGADGHLNDGVASTSHQAGTSGSGSSSNAGRLASTGRRTSSTGPAARQQQDTDGRYYIKAGVRDPLKMHENTKDAYVSYCIKGETNLPQYEKSNFECRRRFQDFVFLHDHLMKDFPACVVPPLPGKHRLEYLKGDRFGPEFVEKRTHDLNRFLERLARHPTLSRATLLQDFCESTEWNIRMHKHAAHPPMSPDSASSVPGSIIDSLSDTLLNAFAKLRKPDERFLEVRDSLDKFEESLLAIERTEARARIRLGDLANDYEDFAASVQGLGELESGITEPLARYEQSLLDFAMSLRTSTAQSAEIFLAQVHSLHQYTHAFRNVLKLRDQKQLDFEDLSAYLSNLSMERDRLANGYSAGTGLGSYFKDKVESLRGGDADLTREGKIRKLDGKIKELQDAVSAAHDTSVAFDEEVLREHRVFQAAKRTELRDLLLSLADGHIAHYEKAMGDMQRCQPHLESIRVN
ncbi:intercellular trafficking and secretion [Cystobasidiomycetes sp. EMM_F5]